MALDILAGVVVLWGLVRGWLRGLLFQLGQIGMLAVAFVAARSLRGVVEPWLGDVFGARPMVRESLAFFLVFLVVAVIGTFIVRRFTSDLHRLSGTLTAGDRILGAAAGALKGALVAYLLVVALIMANQITGAVPVPYASSTTGRFVMSHNFLESEEFPRAQALVKLGWLLGTRSAVDLVEDPHIAAILEHPKAQVLRSPEVMQALAASDWLALVGNEAIWDLLDEPDIQAHLEAIEWQEAQEPAPAPGALPPAPRALPSAPARCRPAGGAPARLILRALVQSLGVRARAATSTEAAPARKSARLAARAVVPVVITSSTNRTARPPTRSASPTYTPASRRCRARHPSPRVGATARPTPRPSGSSGSPSARARPEASTPAGLKPRARSRAAADGTGTTRVSRASSAQPVAAARRTISRASGGPRVWSGAFFQAVTTSRSAPP
ncbi:MAG: CvpA family protein [Deltaproteobacteria bacterium]|nr:CvpA family protein [Deltaproteobacteria bacterium]